LLGEFPKKHWPLTTVKHLQQKIIYTGTVNNNRQLESGRKQKVILKKIQYNFSNTLLILCKIILQSVNLRFKVVIHKSCREGTFSRHSRLIVAVNAVSCVSAAYSDMIVFCCFVLTGDGRWR